MKIHKALCFITTAIVFQLSAVANEHGNFRGMGAASVCQHIVKPYQEGSWDIYLTGYAWHAGATFSGKELNSRAYGGGVGKHWVDAKGHEDLLYAFAFIDSYKQLQPTVGYARQWFTKPIGPILLGGGFTVGLTGREDIFRYLPLPVLLPIGSVRFKKFSLMSTAIPRRKGALGLVWVRYQF
ncbi:MAG: palmitoyl transferase [Glomeribacter sp. 1016415]|nr:palmitoyl transferase [Glomeribacter sp. 1016415]